MIKTPYDRVIEKFLDREVQPASRIIDVGCGTGWTALFLARRKPGSQIVGIDIDTLTVHRANALFRRARREKLVQCHRCGVEQLRVRFGTQMFDCAITSHTLHHFERPAAALRQIRAVLKRGGRLLLVELSPRYGEALDDCPRYSLVKIKEFVRRAGFRRVGGAERAPGVVLVRASR
ncbi:class I SAM-dependent methyltransferase [Candidatus Parcubacteria bacterium]|nr:class I SAM-dependent methyltransferase [Candidatus Parcubacteria bacterium]